MELLPKPNPIQPSTSRRVWCFDVENRPGPYGGQDFTFKDMLSLAGCWEDEYPEGLVYVAPGYDADELERFAAPLRQNPLSVTHNGNRHDLPLLSGTLIKMGLAPLPRVMSSDTFAHLPKTGQAWSKSLKNMAARFGVAHKGEMTEYDWECAYHGEPWALEKLRIYNTGDVTTTLQLRAKLLELGLLGAPRWWRP